MAVYVTEKKYYEDRLADSKIMAARDTAIQSEFYSVRVLLTVSIIVSTISAGSYLVPLVLHLPGG